MAHRSQKVEFQREGMYPMTTDKCTEFIYVSTHHQSSDSVIRIITLCM